MKKIFLLVLVVAWVSITLAQTGDFLKLRQSFNGDYGLIYLHNSKTVVWQVAYNSQQSLVLGVGPSMNFKLGKTNITTFAYADAILNLKDTDFPVQSYMGEAFIITSMDRWSLFARTALLTNAENLKTYFSGRDFLGYQLGLYNVRLLSDWKQTDNRTIVFVGPSVEYKINNFSISGYIGADIKSPHPKTGWLNIKLKL